MKLNDEQIQKYNEQGYLFIENCFSKDEIEIMKSELEKLTLCKSPDLAYESDGKTIRALHGCHLRSKLFDNLTKQKRLVDPVTKLLSTDKVYLHQFKINVKKAFDGEYWPWHQDFAYWHMEDGLEKPKNLTSVIFLDDITEFNAPIFFIPGSHNEGSLNELNSHERLGKTPDWKINFGTKPKYTIDQENLNIMAKKYGLTSIKGSAGSVVYFDSNIIHASTQNISPYDRRMIFLAYNRIDNIPPAHLAHKRPDFLASHHYENLNELMLDQLA